MHDWSMRTGVGTEPPGQRGQRVSVGSGRVGEPLQTRLTAA